MAWAWVQSKSATGSAVTTVTATLATTPVTGNKIVVVLGYSSATATITSVKDGNGNSLTQALAPVVQASHGTRAVYFYDVPATPSKAFTLIISGGNDTAMIAQEVSGLAAGNTTAAAIDGTPGSLSGTASPSSSPTYSSATTNEYLMSFFADDGIAATVTVPTGYTADANNVNTSSLENCLIGYKNSTGGSEAAVWTFTGASNYSIVTLAFKLSGGVSPTIPDVIMAPMAQGR